MNNRHLILITVVIGLLAVGVSAQSFKKKSSHTKKPAAVRSLASGAIKTPSGLVYLITQKGNGVQPKVGQTVVVHYTGTLTNGVKFDSSRDRGTPFEFRLGKDSVIQGWHEGIGKLHVGDQAILVIPPALGYGAPGRGRVIPPNATLIFIVELVDVKDVP